MQEHHRNFPCFLTSVLLTSILHRKFSRSWKFVTKSEVQNKHNQGTTTTGHEEFSQIQDSLGRPNCLNAALVVRGRPEPQLGERFVAWNAALVVRGRPELQLDERFVGAAIHIHHRSLARIIAPDEIPRHQRKQVQALAAQINPGRRVAGGGALGWCPCRTP